MFSLSLFVPPEIDPLTARYHLSDNDCTRTYRSAVLPFNKREGLEDYPYENMLCWLENGPF